jgi:hypothetical protein
VQVRQISCRGSTLFRPIAVLARQPQNAPKRTTPRQIEEERLSFVASLGAALIAWGVFLLYVSRILVGESEAFRRSPRAPLSLDALAEAAISPQGRIALGIFIAGAAFIAGGVLTLMYGVAAMWFAP